MNLWDGLLLVTLCAVSASVARAMIGIGIMDIPAGRKAHARPTPKAGGIAPILVMCLTVFIFPIGWDRRALAVTGIATLLGVIGLIDDLRDLAAETKLAAQTLAAVALVSLGPWPAAGWPDPRALIAVGWLVFITNVFNFMDGLDGLAAGVGLCAAACLAIAAPPGSAVQIGALALAAGLAGFLPFNFPHARLFLGDTGSQFCGFMLGALGLGLVVETGMSATIWLLPMLLAGMIIDVGVTLARRAWAGARLTVPHREHFYQRAPLPARRVALLHWALVLFGGLAWNLGLVQRAWPMLILLAVTHFAWLCFVESGAAGRHHPPRGVRNRL